jgi:SAM-dependent methyltransferase
MPAAPPSADAIAAAAERSPLRETGRLSELADADELRYRDEAEVYEDPPRDIVAWMERKELQQKLRYALEQAGLTPRGDIVELGAGTCWLGATLALSPDVRRVTSIEFSRRRIADLAPVAIAHIGAPPEKIERVVADFYDHGLGTGIADMVFMDAAFHHAPDPVRMARVGYDLLRPGGVFVLHREPTLSLIKRSRDHGVEGEHGDFEREYDWWQYLRFLREAGFEASKHPAASSFSNERERARLRPPLSWLNGVAYSTFTYVGRKP